MSTPQLELIEASAGTGKTYTICSKAAELVVKHGVPIHQLLMVTFTNKAASEMQDRLRLFLTEIERGGQHSPEETERAAEALANFDTAQITTFHGFCQMTMVRYGFECLLPLNLAIENDPVWTQKLLLLLIRDKWMPIANSAGMLRAEMLSFVASLVGSRGATSRRIAGSMQSDDLVQPGNLDELLGLLPLSEQQWLEQLAGPFMEFLGSNWSELEADVTLQFEKAAKKGEFDTQTRVIQPLQQLLAHIYDQPIEQSDRVITDVYNGIWRRVRSTSRPFVVQLYGHLKGLKGQLSPSAVFKSRISPGIVAAVASELATMARQNRAERGVVSFNDMVQGLADALNGNPVLCQQIASQYQAALVDEFQDTDPLQWRIIKSLFLQEASAPKHLVLVGDPKQAIYTFRGANVQTYLAAKETLAERGGRITSLDTNYRSSAQFIEAINLLCGDHRLFGEPEPGRLQYLPVCVPPEPGTVLGSGWEGRKPIVIVKTGTDEKRSATSFMQFIVEEIIDLMGQSPEVIFRGGEPRPLRLDDICILCKSHHQAKRIGLKLADAGIAYSNGRSSNIYQTAEAAQLLLVLKALLEPEDHGLLQNALLTRVFGIHPLRLHDRLAVRQAQRLMQSASDMADHRRWDGLFRVLCHHTELLHREITAQDGDRRAANWLHLSQELTTMAVDNHDDLASLVRRLQCLMDGGGSDEQTGQLRKEADQPKVQVVTMHASKGLEYGVVFLLLGQKDASSDYRTLCYADHMEFLCQHEKDDAGIKAADIQFAEEQQRLLYVAMTRARCRLYMPLHEKSTSAMAKCLDNMVSERELSQVQQITYSRNPDGSRMFMHASTTLAGDLLEFRAAPEYMRSRLSWIHSFSSLPIGLTRNDPSSTSDSSSTPPSDHTFWQLASTEGDGLSSLRSDDDTSYESEEAGIPTGAEAGTLFHSVLQAVDFEMVRQCTDAQQLYETVEFRQLVLDAIPLSGMAVEEGEPAWLPEIADRIWHTLHAVCPMTGAPLGDIPLATRRAELPFHVCMNQHDGLVDDLYGIIDLVFELNGKIYILDWKSNSSPSGYGASSISEMMEHGGYHGQYRTYTLALQRLYEAWGMTDLWSRFGGICYVFLRGVHVGSDEGFYVRTDIGPAEIEQFGAHLTDYMAYMRQGITHG